MGDVIIARFRWDLETFLAAHTARRHRGFRRGYRRALWSISILVIVLSGVVTIDTGDWTPSIVILAGGILYALSTWVSRLLLRKNFAKRPDVHIDVEWRFCPDAITVASDLGHGDLTWNSIIEVTETPRGYLLFTTPEIFHWIPKNGFTQAEAADAFTALARDKVAEYRVVT